MKICEGVWDKHQSWCADPVPKYCTREATWIYSRPAVGGLLTRRGYVCDVHKKRMSGKDSLATFERIEKEVFRAKRATSCG